MHKNPALPVWAEVESFSPKTADADIAAKEADPERQRAMRAVFGMIKLVDDNVGRLLNYLDKAGQTKDTIVVFTSDHGDMMDEHGRMNKGVPYKASSQVPFLIKWPGKIRRGKVVETAYSSVDFVPTILGLMGVTTKRIGSPGIDGSVELQRRQAVRHMARRTKRKRWGRRCSTRACWNPPKRKWRRWRCTTKPCGNLGS